MRAGLEEILLIVLCALVMFICFMLGASSVDQVTVTNKTISMTTCDVDAVQSDLNTYTLQMQKLVRDIEPECNSQLFLPEDRDLFFQTITHNGNARPYELDKYDCDEFSENLVHDLKQLGWKAKKKEVVVDCDSGMFESVSCNAYSGRHAIVQVDRIYIEATSGTVIPTWDYEGYGLR